MMGSVCLGPQPVFVKEYGMNENFDPKGTAESVEEVGKLMLRGVRLPFDHLLPGMGDLNPTQVKDLGNQLLWDNCKPNGMPSVNMSVGLDGHITGFTFTKALSDLQPATTSNISVSTGHRDSGVRTPDAKPASHANGATEYQD